jgi:hypothetical protein
MGAYLYIASIFYLQVTFVIHVQWLYVSLWKHQSKTYMVDIYTLH